MLMLQNGKGELDWWRFTGDHYYPWLFKNLTGNLLVNVGPTKEGTIPAIMEERLRQMGDWLAINGEAIYSSKPWTHQNDSVTPGVW